MASVYGHSKGWKEITAQLDAFHLTADHPKEIEPLLEHSLALYDQQNRLIHNNLEIEIARLVQDISQEKEKVKFNLASFSELSSLDILQTEANLDFLKQDRSIFNFIRNFFRTRRESRKLARLRAITKEQRSAIEQGLHTKEMELEQKLAQKDEMARLACHEVIAQIDFLKSISGSQELACIIAEFDLLETLKRLPSHVHIFNNINLRVERGILFAGKWLINAHIDQLLVTPAGLFAIEVKNWSKQVGEKGFSLDPYEQIQQAAQLCYELIKTDFPGVTVHSILAYRGQPPEHQKSGLVKALPLSDVTAYVNWFTDNALTPQTLQKMVARIQEINTA